jgi:ABC-type antimicrobial peptide transport system permease subunit
LHVLRLLLQDLFQTIGISSVLAWLLAFLATSLYFEDYAFRKKLNLLYFITPSIAVALITLFAIFYKTWKVAQIAPAAFKRKII